MAIRFIHKIHAICGFIVLLSINSVNIAQEIQLSVHGLQLVVTSCSHQGGTPLWDTFGGKLSRLVSSTKAKRFATVCVAAIIPLATTGDAWAGEYTSSLSGVRPGFESSRWTDDGGTGVTKIEFTTCKANSGSTPFSSTHVKMWQHKSLQPDPQKGATRKYVACKSGTSVGEFPAMSSGDVLYFEVDKINDWDTNISLDVSHVRIAY